MQPSDFLVASELPQKFDVLVVGAGAAGLYTSLCLPSHFHIGLVTKEPLSLSASDWAQGGIAAVIDPEDSPELHIHDTQQAGAGLCDYSAVKFLVEQSTRCIHQLVDLGVGFDRHQGTLALTLEAAHSRRRVLHAADTTGRAVVSVLAAQVLKRKNIQVISPAYTLDLWLHPQTQRCQGMSLFYQGHLLWLQAGAVILATGGGGQVYAQTTNPALSTGDGVAIAHRAGAILQDLEFVQFHPTALNQAGAPRFLISEAVRGEGAHLVDETGRRFAFDYHPAGELAPRDVVSRAIFSYLQSRHADPSTAHVWLDMRSIPPDRIHHRFPNIVHICQRWGIDAFQEPIPVSPAAHYWMGGIATNLLNQTSIPGLYAVGETASTGVHGANRLASNSLLECLVFGAQFAHLEVQSFNGFEGNPSISGTAMPLPQFADEIVRLRRELPRLIWQSAGICREGDRMASAIQQVEDWLAEFAALPLSQVLQTLPMGQSLQFQSVMDEQLRAWAETRNLLSVGYLILKSANFRTESRGGHYRSDYPQMDATWQTHTLVQGGLGTPIQATHWWKSPIRTEE